MPENMIAEIGAIAVVMGSFGFMLRWVLQKFDKSINSLVRAVNVNTVAVLAMQKQLLAHDLTVTGLNPATGVDIDERTNKALAKYREISLDMEELKRLVLSDRSGES